VLLSYVVGFGRFLPLYLLIYFSTPSTDQLLIISDFCCAKKKKLRPASSQFVLERNFSYHCPVLFKSKNVHWGAKPFRVLDCWLKDKSFGKIVKECWTQTQLSGWGGLALKEKIKRLKERLKSCNKEQFGDTFKRVQQLEAKLNKLESEAADRHMTPQEITIRKRLQQDLWGGGTDQKKIAWVKWDTICLPKQKGGLEIKHISLFNKALLGKWWWNLMQQNSEIWAKILDSKYGGRTYSR